MDPLDIDDLMLGCVHCCHVYDTSSFDKHEKKCTVKMDTTYELLSSRVLKYEDIKIPDTVESPKKGKKGKLLFSNIGLF